MTMNGGNAPAWSYRECSLMAPFVVRNFAHGNTDRQRSMVVASMEYSGLLNLNLCLGAWLVLPVLIMVFCNLIIQYPERASHHPLIFTGHYWH